MKKCMQCGLEKDDNKFAKQNAIVRHFYPFLEDMCRSCAEKYMLDQRAKVFEAMKGVPKP